MTGYPWLAVWGLKMTNLHEIFVNTARLLSEITKSRANFRLPKV